MRYRYKRTGKEWLVTLVIGGGICSGLGILFYRHVVGVICLMGLLPGYLYLDGKRREQKRERKLSEQFQEMLESMAGAMQAGYSLERSILWTQQEMEKRHPDQWVMKEYLLRLVERIRMNQTAEQAFEQLAEETELADIREFVLVLITVKRTGGNLIRVMLHTLHCLAMRQETRREIETLMSGKRLEANLMNLLPMGILLYLWIAMPDLMTPLYHNFKGVLWMSVMLLLYGGGYLWTRKILERGESCF